MTISNPSVSWRAKTAVFMVTSLLSSALMQLLVRTYDSAFSIRVGGLALITGVVMAWCTLQRWRFIAPLRCYASVGLCAGFGGAGLMMLFVYLLVYLTSPTGPIQSM